MNVTSTSPRLNSSNPRFGCGQCERGRDFLYQAGYKVEDSLFYAYTARFSTNWSKPHMKAAEKFLIKCLENPQGVFEDIAALAKRGPRPQRTSWFG